MSEALHCWPYGAPQCISKDWKRRFRFCVSRVSGKKTPSGEWGERSDIGSGHDELLRASMSAPSSWN